jgi:hypothetical protein
MTDDELAAVNAEVFKHFDFREGVHKGTSRIKEWVITLLCWDGLLPIAVLSIPNLVALLFPNWPFGIAIFGLFLPVVALCVRFVFGWKRMRGGQAYGWQMIVFTVAISALFLFEAFLLNDQVGPGPKIADPTTLVVMYCVYLAMMVLALFPFRYDEKRAESGKASNT